MPCYSQDNVPDGYIAKFPDGPTYESEEDCLDACAEGACCETDGTCNIKPQCECDTDNGAVFAGVGEGCEACAPCGCEGLEGWPASLSLELLGFDAFSNPLLRSGPPGLPLQAVYEEFPQSCISSAASGLLQSFNQNSVIEVAREPGSTRFRSTYSFRRLVAGPGLGLCQSTGGPYYSTEYFIAIVSVNCQSITATVATQIESSACQSSFLGWTTPGVVQHSAIGGSSFSCDAISSGAEIPAGYPTIGVTAYNEGNPCEQSGVFYDLTSPQGMRFRISSTNPLP